MTDYILRHTLTELGFNQQTPNIWYLERDLTVLEVLFDQRQLGVHIKTDHGFFNCVWLELTLENLVKAL